MVGFELTTTGTQMHLVPRLGVNLPEKQAHSDGPVRANPPSSAPACPDGVPDRPLDIVEQALTDGLLRAVAAGDFEAYARIKDKLDAWREGQT